MNHLEPLCWPVPLLREGLAAHEREPLLQQHGAELISLSIRSTFRVIASFLEGCRQSAPPTFLAGSIHGARELGRVTFELAFDHALLECRLRSDWERCLEDLDRLPRSLSGGAALPRWELVHALDTLIGLLIQLDGPIGRQIASLQAPTLNRPSTVRSRTRCPRAVKVRGGDAARDLASGS